MAAISLSWDANMAAMMSCEKTHNWWTKKLTVAMLVYQNNLVGIELFTHLKSFFCFHEFAWLLTT